MTVLLGIRFLAEIAMLGALAWGGWHLVDGPLALLPAVLIPVVAALVWGRWVAPRSAHRLPDPGRAGVELVLFMLAFVLVTQAGPQPQATSAAMAMLLAYLVSMPARHAQL
jgi:hypothetical protein